MLIMSLGPHTLVLTDQSGSSSSGPWVRHSIMHSCSCHSRTDVLEAMLPTCIVYTRGARGVLGCVRSPFALGLNTLNSSPSRLLFTTKHFVCELLSNLRMIVFAPHLFSWRVACGVCLPITGLAENLNKTHDHVPPLCRARTEVH